MHKCHSICDICACIHRDKRRRFAHKHDCCSSPDWVSHTTKPFTYMSRRAQPTTGISRKALQTCVGLVGQPQAMSCNRGDVRPSSRCSASPTVPAATRTSLCPWACCQVAAQRGVGRRVPAWLHHPRQPTHPATIVTAAGYGVEWTCSLHLARKYVRHLSGYAPVSSCAYRLGIKCGRHSIAYSGSPKSRLPACCTQ